MNRKMSVLVSIFAAMLLLRSTEPYAQQTTGHIVKFGPGSTPDLRDSKIVEDPISHNLGVGAVFDTTPPSAQLHVDGSVRIDDGSFSQSSVGNFDVDAPYIPGGRLRVTESGYVGIGINDPWFKLDVRDTTNVAIQGWGRNTGVVAIADNGPALWAATNSRDNPAIVALSAVTGGLALRVFGSAEISNRLAVNGGLPLAGITLPNTDSPDGRGLAQRWDVY